LLPYLHLNELIDKDKHQNNQALPPDFYYAIIKYREELLNQPAEIINISENPIQFLKFYGYFSVFVHKSDLPNSTKNQIFLNLIEHTISYKDKLNTINLDRQQHYLISENIFSYSVPYIDRGYLMAATRTILGVDNHRTFWSIYNSSYTGPRYSCLTIRNSNL